MPSEMKPLVSAIIPTYNRPVLVVRAVESVLAQTYENVEAVVAIDGVSKETRIALDRLCSPRVTVVETGISGGPVRARRAAVEASKGQILGLLDDDDEWMPQKIDQQMNFVHARGLLGSEFIVSCRIEMKSLDGGSVISPGNLYTSNVDLSEYLFDRRSPIARPGIIGSGTPLFPRSLVERVPFPEESSFHDDLAWILTCVSCKKVPLYMIEDVGFVYYLAAATRNQTPDWRHSLAFARRYKALNCMSGRAFAGLLSTTTAWRAKRRDGLGALAEIARIMRTEGEPRIAHWISLCGIALLPLDTVDKWRRHRRS
jgi:glycosyltransferase involved in cell wall biosynthesis